MRNINKRPIFYNACPRCNGTVTAEDIGEGDGLELYCVVCGNRRDFHKVNFLLNYKDKLIHEVLKRP